MLGDLPLLDWLLKLIKAGKPVNSFSTLDQQELKSLLTTKFKYQSMPDLIGKGIHIESLKTLENDLITGLKADFPGIKELWHEDKNWTEDSDLPGFWKSLRFQISLSVEGIDIPASVSDTTLIELAYLREVDAELVINTSELADDGWLQIKSYLEEKQDSLYLHLLLYPSVNIQDSWNCYTLPKETRDAIFKYLDSPEYENGHPIEGRRYLSENIVGEVFFPREMFIIDACLTNIPGPLVWFAKWVYF